MVSATVLTSTVALVPLVAVEYASAPSEDEGPELSSTCLWSSEKPAIPVVSVATESTDVADVADEDAGSLDAPSIDWASASRRASFETKERGLVEPAGALTKIVGIEGIEDMLAGGFELENAKDNR